MADVQDYINHILADSPLLYWPLQETTGNALDVSGNDNHGVFTSGGLWELTNPMASKGDKAFHIPTASTEPEYLKYTGSLPTNVDGFSLEFLFKSSVSASPSNPLLYAGSGQDNFAIYLTNTSLRFATQGSTGRITPTNSAVTDYWYSCVYTQDASGNSKIYQNGKLISGPTSQPTPTNFNNLTLSNGKYALTDTWWQHIAVFDKVLSDSRIEERWALTLNDQYEFRIFDGRKPYSIGSPENNYTPNLTEGQLWPRGNL
ncbi:MAG TPA: hypothetical protein PLM10_02075 [Saccharofermentans sp.]|nr:hypothetical protein [Saccharofermentans sp.]